MADRFYGLDRGDTEFNIAEATSSPTKDVEVVIDLAVSLEKSEVIEKLDEIRNHIVKGNWPPA